MTEMKYVTTGMYTRFKCTRFETDEKKQTFQRLTLYLFLPVTKTRTIKYYIRCQCTVFVGVRVSHLFVVVLFCVVFGGVRVSHLCSFLFVVVFGGVRVSHLCSFLCCGF